MHFLGIPDIESVRNVMDAGWAGENHKAAELKIYSRSENCGWLLFPDGTKEAAVGQAHPSITLPNSKTYPILFELLRGCHVLIGLEKDFIFDNDTHAKYPTSFLDLENLVSGGKMMPIGFKPRVKRKKSLAGAKIKMKDELENQLDWYFRYEYGRTASIKEWNLYKKSKLQN